MKITIREVAQRAGVSIGTASRVMNSHSNVGTDNRKRVLEAVSELGYTPNSAAQSMRRGGTRMIGIIVRDITIPVLAGFVRAAQDLLQAADYTLLICCSEDLKARELALMAQLARRQIDGLIMTTCDEEDPELLAARQAMGLPVVLLDREAPSPSDAILIGHADGVRRAVRSLGAAGHRRIALVTGEPSVYPGRSRIKGYMTGCEEAGVALDTTLIRSRSFAEEQAFVEFSMLLSPRKPPTALIAGGISMLPAALRAIRSRGMRIPDDVSLIGSADSELAMLSSPPISMICWSYADLGRTGAQLLLDRIAGIDTDEGRRVVFPTELVMRESCGQPKPAEARVIA